MSGKPECVETAETQVRQIPDGKVKAELPEPKCSLCNVIRLDMSNYLDPRQGTRQGFEDL